ncbi:hypothetical protein MMON_06880 [Mycolicibacterium monacense]|uniref:Uncharacterized protein n=1 Tax=Mycolicibacterium monacense TaxID=85693 RepID=A0AAD1ITC8_MYCMB|nr:hypothetical protein MMON_06880 [Mycolicibacterium monacense]
MLPATVASTTRTPALRSSGINVAIMFSIPPYPCGGTVSHGPALMSTVSDMAGEYPGPIDVCVKRAYRRKSRVFSASTGRLAWVTAESRSSEPAVSPSAMPVTSPNCPT